MGIKCYDILRKTKSLFCFITVNNLKFSINSIIKTISFLLIIFIFFNCGGHTFYGIYKNKPYYQGPIINGKNIAIINFLITKKVGWVYHVRRSSKKGEPTKISYRYYRIQEKDVDFRVLKNIIDEYTGLITLDYNELKRSSTFNNLLMSKKEKLRYKSSTYLPFIKPKEIGVLDKLSQEINCDYYLVSEIWIDLPAIDNIPLLGPAGATESLVFEMHIEIYDRNHQLLWVDEYKKEYDYRRRIKSYVVEKWIADFTKLASYTMIKKLASTFNLIKNENLSEHNSKKLPVIIPESVIIPEKEETIISEENYHLNLAIEYHESGDYEKALIKYKKVIKLNPKNVRAAYNIACIYSVNYEIAKAIEWLKYVLELNPNLKERIKKDPDFNMIRNKKEFINLISTP